MSSEPHVVRETPAPNLFTGADVAAILRERGWVAAEAFSPEMDVWCERAAAMLGSHVADREALGELLGLIVHYDAAHVLEKKESHAVLARYGARDVVRLLALALLEGGTLDSNRFKEIITAMKEARICAAGICFILFGWRWRAERATESWTG